jgi:hypothetical protein
MSVLSEEKSTPWLMLTFSLAAKKASQRVEVWRLLQRHGAVALGNSGYLLPNLEANRERFQWLASMIRSHKGESSVVEVRAIDNLPKAQLVERFNQARTRDYQILTKEIEEVTAMAPGARRLSQLGRVRSRFQEIATVDFFGSAAQKRIGELIALAERGTKNAAAPRGSKRKDYQGKVWVTRPRPGIDRSASAWLIRQFIDAKARFVFAADGEAPTGAIPFDMYQGGFGHRGEDCSFETLRKEFHVRDARVVAIGEMVHDADLGDGKFGRREAYGVDEVLKGWARKGMSNKELLERGMEMIEGLYRAR